MRSKSDRSNKNDVNRKLVLVWPDLIDLTFNVTTKSNFSFFNFFFHEKQNIPKNMICPNAVSEWSEVELLLHTAGMSSVVLIFQRCDACCALMWFKAVVWHAAQHIWPIQFNIFFINYFASVRVGGALISLASRRARRFKYHTLTNIVVCYEKQIKLQM